MSTIWERTKTRLASNPSLLENKRRINREYMRRSSNVRILRYKANKALMLRQLGGKCEKCGFTDVRALQFDHVDPKKKHSNLTGLMARKDLAKLFDELHKCRLLCANCHAIGTHDSGILRVGKPRKVGRDGE